jgi:hypothetical protein
MEDLDADGGQTILDDGSGVNSGAIRAYPNGKHPCSTRIGLFFFICFIKMPRTSRMYTTFRVDPLETICQ